MLSDDLSKEVTRILSKLEETEPGTEEYEKLKQDLLDLDRAKLAEEKSEFEAGWEDAKLEAANAEMKRKNELKWYQKLDPNAVLSAAVSLVSIGTILNFEKLGVITSKALSFVHKPRLK